MRRLLTSLILCLSVVIANAQSKYQYAVDIANIKDGKVSVSLKTPAISQETAVFSFPKAIPGSYARKNFGRFIDELQATDKEGKLLKIKKLNEDQYQISSATTLASITYKVSGTWYHKNKDFIFQPGGTNIEAGLDVVMNNHAFYGYFEGMSKLPFEIIVTKPEAFYAATYLDVSHVSAAKDSIYVKDYVYLADNPIIYSKPDTTSFYAGKTKINVSVYSVNGKIKSAQIAGYLKPITFALAKFFNGLPVSSYQFLYFFEDSKRALTDKKNGEGGYGALEHNYSSLYYLPEMDYEKDLISMINDVSTHEFLHILTPLNLHSYEIANFNFTTPAMSKQLWMYEGVTEYFAHLVEMQSGLVTEKQFFAEMRKKMNQAEEFGDFPMTEMSKNVMDDSWQKKYNSVYNRGALLGLMLDIYIRDKTNNQKTLKSVIVDLTHKYGPNQPFEDDKFIDE
ncbi:MAG: M61 family metallopeptidase, partial [Mucilaginibacter sp.]